MIDAKLKNISVYISIGEEIHELRTYANEYRSLMMLIHDQVYTDDFGECLGMGKCGTCLVKIKGTVSAPTLYERNEERTLSRSGQAGMGFYLACQIMIDEAINGAIVTVI
jgi:ferredoxin, 2Fe-2S